jgi:hypothetical protein
MNRDAEGLYERGQTAFQLLGSHSDLLGYCARGLNRLEKYFRQGVSGCNAGIRHLRREERTPAACQSFGTWPLTFNKLRHGESR